MMAIAALTLTALTARAFNEQMLAQANLTEEERLAFVTARELQSGGDVESAKAVLVEAGIDEFVLERLKLSMAEYQSSSEDVYRLPGTTTESRTDVVQGFDVDTSSS